MKKVITVLALTLGACASAFATNVCSPNSIANPGDTCAAATGDGTNFTVSLLSLTDTTLSSAVNLNVNGSSTSAGTDTFTVQVVGVNGARLSGANFGANFDVSIVGPSGDVATITAVNQLLGGRGTGASLSTSVIPNVGSSLGPWTLNSSTTSNASSSHTISPSFISAEVDTGLTLPSGLTLSGYTETFTVIWTAYVPPPPPPPPPPVKNNDPVDPPAGVPEPGSIGLVAFAGILGGLMIRRRSLKK